MPTFGCSCHMQLWWHTVNLSSSHTCQKCGSGAQWLTTGKPKGISILFSLWSLPSSSPTPAQYCDHFWHGCTVHVGQRFIKTRSYATESMGMPLKMAIILAQPLTSEAIATYSSVGTLCQNVVMEHSDTTGRIYSMQQVHLNAIGYVEMLSHFQWGSRSDCSGDSIYIGRGQVSAGTTPVEGSRQHGGEWYRLWQWVAHPPAPFLYCFKMECLMTVGVWQVWHNQMTWPWVGNSALSTTEAVGTCALPLIAKVSERSGYKGLLSCQSKMSSRTLSPVSPKPLESWSHGILIFCESVKKRCLVWKEYKLITPGYNKSFWNKA